MEQTIDKQKTIETKTAEAITQEPEKVTVGDRSFIVQPPSVATLILVSEAVSRLPRFNSDGQNVLEQTLANAKNCEPLGEIAAILILGARAIREAQEPRKQSRWSLIRNGWRKADSGRETASKSELTRLLLEQMTPRELFNLIARLLNRMQIADFFGLTTFLTEINLLRQTKVEGEEN